MTTNTEYAMMGAVDGSVTTGPGSGFVTTGAGFVTGIITNHTQTKIKTVYKM